MVSKAEAAIISTYPQEQNISQGENFTAEIRLDSEEEVINTIEAEIIYPKDILEVIDVSKGGSFLTLWVTDPVVKEKEGTIYFAGGIPNGSYVVNGKVLTITFHAKRTGTAEIAINKEKTGVYLNDGLGTKTNLNTITGKYKIEFPSPYTINLTSSTHPFEDTWYQTSTIIISWEERANAAYSYKLDNDSQIEPDDKTEAVVGEVTFENLKDGIYYFVIKEKLPDDDWGPITRRRFMIDQTPPQPLEYYITEDVISGKKALVFSARDLTSGIEQYQVQEGEKVYANSLSPFVLPDQSRKKVVIIRAIDKAGNVTEATIQPITSNSTSWSLIIILTVVIVVILVFLLSRFLNMQKGKNKGK